MVVANVSGEVTLKRLYREGERVRLQPANSMMSPIYASARDVMVQGGDLLGGSVNIAARLEAVMDCDVVYDLS